MGLEHILYLGVCHIPFTLSTQYSNAEQGLKQFSEAAQNRAAYHIPSHNIKMKHTVKQPSIF